jgi:hypothetical protein
VIATVFIVIIWLYLVHIVRVKKEYTQTFFNDRTVSLHRAWDRSYTYIAVKSKLDWTATFSKGKKSTVCVFSRFSAVEINTRFYVK